MLDYENPYRNFFLLCHQCLNFVLLNDKAKPPKRINLHEYRPDPSQQLTAADRSVEHSQIRTLHIDKPGYCTTLAEDNYVRNWIQSEPINHFGRKHSVTAAILISKGKVLSTGRAKQLDSKFHCLKIAIKEKYFLIRYVPSALNYSDRLTKSLERWDSSSSWGCMCLEKKIIGNETIGGRMSRSTRVTRWRAYRGDWRSNLRRLQFVF